MATTSHDTRHHGSWWPCSPNAHDGSWKLQAENLRNLRLYPNRFAGLISAPQRGFEICSARDHSTSEIIRTKPMANHDLIAVWEEHLRLEFVARNVPIDARLPRLFLGRLRFYLVCRFPHLASQGHGRKSF